MCSRCPIPRMEMMENGKKNDFATMYSRQPGRQSSLSTGHEVSKTQLEMKSILYSVLFSLSIILFLPIYNCLVHEIRLYNYQYENYQQI